MLMNISVYRLNSTDGKEYPSNHTTDTTTLAKYISYANRVASSYSRFHVSKDQKFEMKLNTDDQITEVRVFAKAEVAMMQIITGFQFVTKNSTGNFTTNFGTFNSNQLYLVTEKPKDYEYGFLGLFFGNRGFGSIHDASVTWVKSEHWTDWSQCLKSISKEVALCGGGTQTRKRVKNGRAITNPDDLTPAEQRASTQKCAQDDCPKEGKLQLTPAFKSDLNPTSGLLTLYVNGTYQTVCKPKLQRVEQGVSGRLKAFWTKLGNIACDSMKLGKFKSAMTFDDSDLSYAEYRNNSELDEAKMHTKQPWNVACSGEFNADSKMSDVLNQCTIAQYRSTGCRSPGDSIVLSCSPRIDMWESWGACSQDCLSEGSRELGIRKRTWLCYSDGCKPPSGEPDTEPCNRVDCPADGTIKLVSEEANSGIGLIKVFHKNATSNVGKWGTMCNDFFTPSVGKVVCRSVGYVNFVQRIRPATYQTKYGLRAEWKSSIEKMPILYDDVMCNGNERHLSDCYFVSPMFSYRLVHMFYFRVNQSGVVVKTVVTTKTCILSVQISRLMRAKLLQVRLVYIWVRNTVWYTVTLSLLSLVFY